MWILIMLIATIRESFVFLLGGSPVSWCSQRQKIVPVSTTDTEYIAASEASREAVWLRRFINGLEIDGCPITRAVNQVIY
jgi:hypothetical protein